MSNRADREVRELNGRNHPRTQLSPFVELEVMDEKVALAGEDENRIHFDPDVHPRSHRASDPDEPVCDEHGAVCDVMGDTGPIDEIVVGPDPVEPEFDSRGTVPVDEVATGSDPVGGKDLMFDTDPIEIDLGINL